MKKVEEFYYYNKSHNWDKKLENKKSILSFRQSTVAKVTYDRAIDEFYNDLNSNLQVHTFGCSFTYGHGVKQRETFTHLLGSVNVSVFNHGVRGGGIDTISRMVCNAWKKYRHDNIIYIITLPQIFRRVLFSNKGVAYFATAQETESVFKNVDGSEYNLYYDWLHHYELINTFVGKENIIWGTWGEHKLAKSDVPKDKVDVYFDCVDYSDQIHPGVESHKNYADILKSLIYDRI